jgi:hypothetical protein
MLSQKHHRVMRGYRNPIYSSRCVHAVPEAVGRRGETAKKSARAPDFYSVRNASVGEMRAALLAGSQHAKIPIVTSNAAMPAKTSGSLGET